MFRDWVAGAAVVLGVVSGVWAEPLDSGVLTSSPTPVPPGYGFESSVLSAPSNSAGRVGGPTILNFASSASVVVGSVDTSPTTLLRLSVPPSANPTLYVPPSVMNAVGTTSTDPLQWTDPQRAATAYLGAYRAPRGELAGLKMSPSFVVPSGGLLAAPGGLR